MKKPIVIGVAGGTGSGKTTIVQNLVEMIEPEQVIVLEHDSYYLDRSHLPPDQRRDINYDHPDALETSLLIGHLKQFARGESVNVPIYDFSKHIRVNKVEHIDARDVIILEGILILCNEELRDLMDIRIFVETDDDVRFIRRMKRDINERGRTLDSVIEQYLNSVKPMHQKFVAPSKRFADLIIPEGGYNRVAIDMMLTKIRSIITV